jgi:hypothetical protein
MELDEGDLADFRRLYASREAGIMYNTDIDFHEAVNLELEMISFQHHIFEKYLAGEDLEGKDWHIDEVSGEIYLWG